MAFCLPNEQMLQLTFPPLFEGGGSVLKTLAYSQQLLLASFFYFSLLHSMRTTEDNGPFMLFYSRMISWKAQRMVVIRQYYCHQLKCICNFQLVFR